MDKLEQLQLMWEAMNIVTRVTVQPVRDMDQQIPQDVFNPHYTDRRFDHRALTIFVRDGYTLKQDRVTGYDTVSGAFYNYSDRIYSPESWDKAKEGFEQFRSARFLEAYLRLAMNEPELTLVHILAGVNVSNGYPYQVYGYIVPKSVA